MDKLSINAVISGAKVKRTTGPAKTLIENWSKINGPAAVASADYLKCHMDAVEAAEALRDKVWLEKTYLIHPPSQTNMYHYKVLVDLFTFSSFTIQHLRGLVQTA